MHQTREGLTSHTQDGRRPQSSGLNREGRTGPGRGMTCCDTGVILVPAPVRGQEDRGPPGVKGGDDGARTSLSREVNVMLRQTSELSFLSNKANKKLNDGVNQGNARVRRLERTGTILEKTRTISRRFFPAA